MQIRQPLLRLEIILAHPEEKNQLKPFLPLLCEEVHVRTAAFVRDTETYVSYIVKPNYPVLGKRLGKEMKACAEAIAALPASELRARVYSAQGYDLSLPSGVVTLREEDILVTLQPKEGFGVAGSIQTVVALSPKIDSALQAG